MIRQKLLMVIPIAILLFLPMSVSASVTTVEKTYESGYQLKEDDKVLYNANEITNITTLEKRAEANINDYKDSESLIKASAVVTNTTDSVSAEVIDTKYTSQLLSSIETADGDVINEYALTAIGTLAISSEVATPGSGNYDSSYSARSYAKIIFETGYVKPDYLSISVPYVKIKQVKASWYIADNSVSVVSRTVYSKQKGINIANNTWIGSAWDDSSGYYESYNQSSNVSSAHDVIKKYQLFQTQSMLRCTATGLLQRGSYQWYFSTVISLYSGTDVVNSSY